MIVRANIVANTSNASVILDSVTGVVREDIFVSNVTLRERNVRVLQIYSGNGVVQLSQNVSITTGNLVQFQKLVANTGLIASESRTSYFLRDKVSYNPAIDPRLPKVTTLYSPLTVTDSNVIIRGNTQSLGINPVSMPATATQDRYAANIQFSSLSGIDVGDYLLGASYDANSSVKNVYNVTTNARVIWLGNGNTYVGFNKPVITSAGKTYLFRAPVQPAIRVGSETIYYANAAIDSNTLVLSDITRNVANTQPINQTVTTLVEPSGGAVFELTDATGVQVLDYVLINNTTKTSNVRVIWIPEGEGNANVGISAGISADAGATVKFERDWVWAENTTVSILGSIPL